LIFLCSHVTYLKADGQLYRAKRALALAEELSSISGEQQGCAFLEVVRARYAYSVGDLDAAEAALQKFLVLPRPSRSIYREGEAEDLLASLRLHEGRLDEEFLSAGMRVAVAAKERIEIRSFHELRGEWLLTQRRYREAQDQFEEAIAMAREVGLDHASIEVRLALACVKQGDRESGREVAQRLADFSSNWALAELYLALGDQARAREYALNGYKASCGEGTPYVYAINLRRNRAVLDAIGVLAPRVPVFDESKAEPLPFESVVRAFIEELKQKKKPRESR
jgi:tetratricopeptide (TPR) repeat protein